MGMWSCDPYYNEDFRRGETYDNIVSGKYSITTPDGLDAEIRLVFAERLEIENRTVFTEKPDNNTFVSGSNALTYIGNNILVDEKSWLVIHFKDHDPREKTRYSIEIKDADATNRLKEAIEKNKHVLIIDEWRFKIACGSVDIGTKFDPEGNIVYLLDFTVDPSFYTEHIGSIPMPGMGENEN